MPFPLYLATLMAEHMKKENLYDAEQNISTIKKSVNKVLYHKDSGEGEIKRILDHLLLSPTFIVHYALDTMLYTKFKANILCSRF